MAAVKQHELGTSVADICRKLGTAEGTFNRWEQQYGGLEPNEARELKQLREENAKLKIFVSDQCLDKAMARYLLDHYGVSPRRACRIAALPRKMFTYVPKRPPQEALRKRIVELARSRVRYGYKRVHVMLMREGIHVNKKRVHRLYCLEGLQLRARRPRRIGKITWLFAGCSEYGSRGCWRTQTETSKRRLAMDLTSYAGWGHWHTDDRVNGEARE